MSAELLISAMDTFKGIYQKHFETLPNGLLKQLSEECWQKFLQIGLPEKSWEDWQYADLSPMFENFFNAPTLILKKSNSNSKFTSTFQNKVLVENGKFKHANVSADLKVCSISKLNNIELNHFAQLIRTQMANETNPFVLFNYTLLSEGVVVKIADHSEVSLQINSESDSSVFVSPFLLIECGKNSNVGIIFQEVRDQKAIAGINSVMLLNASENSSVKINTLQLDGGNGFHLTQMRYLLNRSANVSVQGVTAGAELLRSDISANLVAEGAEFNCRILSVLKGFAQQHHFIRVNHTAKQGTSTQLFKNILLDRSKVSVDGTVYVSREASQTNSEQLINNLFLSDDARSFTKPNLRILNNDVKCKHGATSGSLEKDNLFYLKSRGLSDEAARQLIMKSFANEVLSYIQDPELLSYISNSVLKNTLGLGK